MACEILHKALPRKRRQRFAGSMQANHPGGRAVCEACRMRKDRSAWASRKRPSGLAGPPGRGVGARALEDLRDCRRRKLVSGPLARCECAGIPIQGCPGPYPGPASGRSPLPAAVRGCGARRPISSDRVGIPAQQCARRDDHAKLTEPAAGSIRPSAASIAIGPGQPRGLDLALRYGDRMAQGRDLDVLGTVGPGEQGKPAEHAQHRQVGETH
jgi:hypothetical protein